MDDAPCSTPVDLGYPAPPEWPGVSIVLPVTGAGHGLMATLKAIDPTDYPGPLEIIVAFGARTSAATWQEVAAEARGKPAIVPVRSSATTAAGLLNAAVYAAQYPLVARLYARGGINGPQLRRAVAALEATGADIVGGALVAVGDGSGQAGVARALNSRLGVGVRPSRGGAGKGPADSVGPAIMRRQTIERVGGYDESFAGAQDWELFHRVRCLGGMVWLDEALSSQFRPATAASQLIRQYFNSGRSRRAVVKRYPTTRSMRYVAAPLTVLVVVGALVLAGVGLAAQFDPLVAFAAIPASYVVGIGLGAAWAGRGLGLVARVRMWWAILIIHMSWGVGYLVGPRR